MSARRFRRGVTVAAAAAMTAVLGSSPLSAFGADTTRLGGPDRVATSIRIYEANRSVFTSDTVVLAGSNSYADALTASPLAAALKAPVLTTPSSGLDSRVLSTLQNQGVSKVVVVGGDRAVPASTEAALMASGIASDRISGADRFATARLIAGRVMAAKGSSSVPVFVASGTGFPDALAAGSAAHRQGGVLLLSSGPTLDRATAAFIDDHASSVVAVGGAAGTAIKSAGIKGDVVAGADRFATAAALASKYFAQPTSAVLASGLSYADAVSGSALAALTGAPMLLTVPTGLPVTTASYLATTKPDIAVLGGTTAVSEGVAARAEAVADTGDVDATTPTADPSPTASPTSAPTSSPSPSSSTTSPTTVAPTFSTQPASGNVLPGQTLTLTATASGTPAPTYQWQKKVDGVWISIAGATGATYTKAQAAAGDAGVYRVVATNSAGSVASSEATVTVNAAQTTTTLTGARFDPVAGTKFYVSGAVQAGGQGRSGITVTVSDPGGAVTGTGTTDANGTYLVELTAPAQAVDALSLTATASATQTTAQSVSSAVTVKVISAPATTTGTNSAGFVTAFKSKPGRYAATSVTGTLGGGTVSSPFTLDVQTDGSYTLVQTVSASGVAKTAADTAMTVQMDAEASGSNGVLATVRQSATITPNFTLEGTFSGRSRCTTRVFAGGTGSATCEPLDGGAGVTFTPTDASKTAAQAVAPPASPTIDVEGFVAFSLPSTVTDMKTIVDSSGNAVIGGDGNVTINAPLIMR